EEDKLRLERYEHRGGDDANANDKGGRKPSTGKGSKKQAIDPHRLKDRPGVLHVAFEENPDFFVWTVPLKRSTKLSDVRAAVIELDKGDVGYLDKNANWYFSVHGESIPREYEQFTLAFPLHPVVIISTTPPADDSSFGMD